MAHFPGPPLPVLANSKCSGAAPVAPVNAIMSALADVAAMKSANASNKRSGIGCSSPAEWPARIGARDRDTRARDAGAKAMRECVRRGLGLPQDMSHLRNGARQRLTGEQL